MNSKTDFGDAYQCLPLTKNENDIIKFIKHTQDTSGGDGDEFYELVIKKIVEETDWREGSTRSILLIFFIQTSHRLTNSAYSLSDIQQHIRQPRIYHLLRHTAVLCHLWPFSSRLTNLIYNLCRILNIVCCRTN